MFGMKKKKEEPLMQYSGRNHQESSPAESGPICKICGQECGTMSWYRDYDACDGCSNEYERDRWRVPAGFESIARSYQFDFDCYAEFQAILGAYSDRIITLEARNQKIAELIAKYEAKEKKENARRQVQEEEKRKIRAENAQRVYDMYGI